MDKYLLPLREGQQFSLFTETSGVSPYTKPPYGNLYNLQSGRDTSGIAPARLLTVKTSDALIVDEVWWAVLYGWHVQAFRLSDRTRLNFIQYIDPKLWRAHYPEGPTEQSEETVPVGNVTWPEPTPESLSWALYGLINEQVPGSGRARLVLQDSLDLADIAKVELDGASLSRALGLLHKWKVPEAESALRERGFSV